LQHLLSLGLDKKFSGDQDNMQRGVSVFMRGRVERQSSDHRLQKGRHILAPMACEREKTNTQGHHTKGEGSLVNGEEQSGRS